MISANCPSWRILDRAYDVEDCNTQALCQNIMDGIRSKVKEGVTLAVDAPKVSVALAVEPLSQVLAHLLQNVAIYTPMVDAYPWR